MKFNLFDYIDTKGMSEEDKSKWEGIQSAFEKAADNYLSDKITPEEWKQSIINAIKGMDEFKKIDESKLVDKKSFDERIEAIDDALLKLKSATEKSSTGELKVKSIEDQIYDQLKEYVSDEKGRKVIDLKSACKSSPGFKKTINLILDQKAVSTVTSANVAPHYNMTIDPTLSVNPRAQTVIRNYANVSNIETRALTYAEFKPGEGDAKWVPEGGLKPSMDATLGEVTVHAGKVALIVKLTEETLSDLPQLVAEIKAELVNRIGIEEERGILSGTGTNGEIKGVLADIPSFSLTGIEVEKANMYDAIVATYTQIVSTSNMSYRPNLILMNPIDYAQMQLEKDANGQYLRPFRVGDELIQGLRVESSTAIKQGELFIGDFNYLNIRDLWQLTITIGWENDDFTKNLVTLIGEKRLMAYIKAQYKTAFVKDKFATVIEAITPSVAPGS